MDACTIYFMDELLMAFKAFKRISSVDKFNYR